MPNPFAAWAPTPFGLGPSIGEMGAFSFAATAAPPTSTGPSKPSAIVSGPSLGLTHIKKKLWNHKELQYSDDISI